MARLTIEDCLQKIDNRYELVPLVAKRARQLLLGKDALVEEENDKPIVIALREIAEGIITLENIDTVGKKNVLDELMADEDKDGSSTEADSNK